MPGAYTQETLSAHFTQVNQRLAAIEAQLAVLSRTAGVPYVEPTASVPADVVELARAGKQIEAIQRYRELTGASFDDARAAVVAL